MRGEIDGIWILQINSTIGRHNVVKLRHCVNQVLSVDIGNDDYIILCNFGGRIMRGFAVIEGMGAVRSAGSKKKAGLIRVKFSQEGLFTVIRTKTTFWDNVFIINQ